VIAKPKTFGGSLNAFKSNEEHCPPILELLHLHKLPVAKGKSLVI